MTDKAILCKGMYVRCPFVNSPNNINSAMNIINNSDSISLGNINALSDYERLKNARDFIMGKISSIDMFNNEAIIKFEDPFGHRSYYDDVQDEYPFSMDLIERCRVFNGSKIKYKKENAQILYCITNTTDHLYSYYIQLENTKEIKLVKENEIEASFINGLISPINQLKNYEFQHPKWYITRSIVNKIVKTIDNSIVGFKELAGCKIFLMPHQLNTIVRCIQNKFIRYMLADEVGMGKTIEAASILKIYLNENSNKKIKIIVPEALKEQWRVELFLKFNISTGKDCSGNEIEILSFSEIEDKDLSEKNDFVIIDEVHRIIQSNKDYDNVYKISEKTDNILLLSATPLQKQTVDYHKLLKILDPLKYGVMPIEKFEALLQIQSEITKSVIVILDNILALQDVMQEKLKENIDLKLDDEYNEIFEEILAGLQKVQTKINDNTFLDIINKISIEEKDFGLQSIKIAISYISDNYQFERNIIRNRRRMINNDYNSTLPIRHLYKSISYELSNYEYTVYQHLVEKLDSYAPKTIEKIINIYKPLLNSFFSSARQFNKEIKKEKYNSIIDDDILNLSSKWLEDENYIIENIASIIDNPIQKNNRIVSIIDYIDQELYDEKIVIFTNNDETFEVYSEILKKIYDKNIYALFNKYMSTDDIELNVYRFQNEPTCRIMLCDETGGEGRNFQKADYIVHLDLPWEANDIEQRIGRLDRLERDVNRPDVNSVVVFSQETIEEQLFQFWSEGLKVFNEPLSGLEIILEKISNQICNSLISDFKYGIYNSIPEIIESTKKLKDTIRKEQLFDTMSYRFKPINNKIESLITYYNKNENELFSLAMFNWANLVGFRAEKNGNIIQFTEKNFSSKLAHNAFLIPPNMTQYMQEEQQKFARRINAIYSKYKNKNVIDGQTIKGTFDRKTAISCDYIHFFAPGDNIFDCIVSNAITSTKGCSTAFAMQSDIDWEGIVFTFSAEPNYSILFENNVSPKDLSAFRNFLTPDLIVIPITLSTSEDKINNIDILKKYNKAVQSYIIETQTEEVSKIEHLGRREYRLGFLHNKYHFKTSTLELFKKKYPHQKWKQIVDESFVSAKKEAVKDIKRKSEIKSAKEEIEHIIAAQVSSKLFYKLENDNIDEIQKKYELIYDCISKPKLKLESACFVWMVK